MATCLPDGATRRHAAVPSAPHERGCRENRQRIKDQPKCPRRVSLLLAGTHLAPILAPGAGRSPLDSSKAADGIVANTHRVFAQSDSAQAGFTNH